MHADELAVYGEPEEGLGHHKAVLVHEIDNPSKTADAWWAYKEKLYLVSLTSGDEEMIRCVGDRIRATVTSPLSMPVLKRILDAASEIMEQDG